jgi:hypothetical protein
VSLCHELNARQLCVEGQHARSVRLVYRTDMAVMVVPSVALGEVFGAVLSQVLLVATTARRRRAELGKAESVTVQVDAES